MKSLRIFAVGVALFGVGAGLARAQETGAAAGQPSSGPQPAGSTANPIASPSTAGAQPAMSGPADSGGALPSTTSPATTSVIAPGAEATAAVAAVWEGPVPSAYLGRAAQMSEGDVAAWLANPRSVLNENPLGGGVMLRFVWSLVGSDNRTVMALVDLVKMPDVRDAQVSAVANGLASAARDSETTAPEYGAYIQWAVAQSGSNELIEAFEKATGADREQTAALGAIGGRAPGAPGSGSLSGAGNIGPSGPVGVNSTVATSAGSSGSRGGNSISFTEGDELGGATGGVDNCTDDTSPVGCVLPN